MNKILGSFLAIAVFASMTATAVGNDKVVWGGGPPADSSYSGKIVPAVIEMLESVRLGGYQWGGVSEGTRENAQHVTNNPTHLAVGQADILRSLNGQPIPGGNGAVYQYTILHEDIGPECLYAVTKNPNYTTLGHILSNAWDISLATGGPNSGSFGTWQILAQTYPDLSDVEVSSVDGASEIVDSVANGHSTFGFFVMRPDPENAVFEQIAKNKLTLVPIVDFDLEGSYEFLSLPVGKSGMFGFGDAKNHTTACTTVSLITGSLDNPKAEGRNAKRLKATIDRATNDLKGSKVKDHVASKFGNDWLDFVKKLKSVSGDSLSALMEASKNAASAALDAAEDAVQ